ncbi:hypothetical protein LV84_01386 [Algoriphagus ratkowskyi]|uniref:Uncharacterized protein n=1 Tax=Algoriphagus ratkowskyi TaxID=57028 RepID=A0A2W7S8Y2_9BACT|nr:hypothetical protein [Algoriphagus ratkowskyi]PZX59355.1 hypothetical protein LV84_01386 [Algoriphagus ratkowskyi]TXD77378.1 hypothetical protein ESW18_11260 [Algoriphagus ratkowskyi]
MKITERNKGDTQDLEDSILIPKEQVDQFSNSLVRILDMIDLENCDRVQREDIKNVYRLLTYFYKVEEK